MWIPTTSLTDHPISFVCATVLLPRAVTRDHKRGISNSSRGPNSREVRNGLKHANCLDQQTNASREILGNAPLPNVGERLMQTSTRDHRLAHRSLAAFNECLVTLNHSRPRSARSQTAIDDKSVSSDNWASRIRYPPAEGLRRTSVKLGEGATKGNVLLTCCAGEVNF
jgi:hypothetical protein